MTQEPSNSGSKGIRASVTDVFDLYLGAVLTYDELMHRLDEILKPRDVTQVTDAEVVAAANVMLAPQSCIDPEDGTFPKFHELDQIAQMELGYQVAVAIIAAEKERFA